MICDWLIKINERSLVGKKPPDETIVIDKFNELKYLISKILNIKKIDNVITEYNIKILTVCFNI